MSAEPEPLFHVHVRAKDSSSRRASLLASNGNTTSLRVHALRFNEERAKKAAAETERENPGFSAKAVRVPGGFL